MYNMILCRFLASLLLNRAEKEPLIVQNKTFVLYSCKNIAIRLPCIAGFSCRAIFRGCAEIFGDIFTSVLATKSPFKLKYTFSFKLKFLRHTCSQIYRTFVDDCSNPNITKKVNKN